MSPLHPARRRFPFLPRGRHAVAAVAALSLLGTAASQVPAAHAAAAPARHPVVDKEKQVPVRAIRPRPAPPDPTAARTMRAAPAVRLPAAGQAEVAVAAAARRAGTLPVLVAAAPTRDSHAPSRVGVRVLDPASAARAGLPVMVRLTRGDGGADAGRVRVTLDYSGFRAATGGDWAARLRIALLPECGLTTPGAPGCGPRPVTGVNDLRTGRITADVEVSGATTAGTLVTLASAPSSTAGDYTATALAASSTWTAGGSAGDFAWSYPFRVVPGLGGPQPELALSYSAQSVDGRTAASNNQPSWAGEGFDLGVGSITRSYKACKDDGHSGSEDQCWAGDNATLTMSGRGGELIPDPGVPNRWHIRGDDGSKVEKLYGAPNGDQSKRGQAEGEYWKVTTLDGTQYFFGRGAIPGGTAPTNSTALVPVFGDDSGEPCNDSAGFASSYCDQAYQWNLDYVVDPDGNTMSYWYTQETNHYARNKSDTAVSGYSRAVLLSRIEYGTRQDAAGNDSRHTAGGVTAQVSFQTADRCVTAGSTCTPSNKDNWPDVPWDLNCTSTTSCPNQYSPSFWTQKMLTGITTRVKSDTGFRDVERWSLKHEFKAPNAGGAGVLWLSGIGHGDAAGTVSIPDVSFTGVQMNNRVDTSASIDPIIRYRIAAITNETGGSVAVTYSAPECVATGLPAPESNTKRCFPVYYTPYGATTPSFGWFHKYVVTQVTTTDGTGANPGGEVVNYNYPHPPAWHYDEAEFVPAGHKSWGQWRGYDLVRVTEGRDGQVQSQSDTTFFRGMNGDKLPSGTRSVSITDSDGGSTPDEPWRQGMTRETIVYDGTGDTAPWVAKTKYDPWEYGPTATRDRNGVTVSAYVTGTRRTTTTTALDGGRAPRVTVSTNTFDGPTGLITTVDDAGDTATTSDDLCTRTTYAQNTARWMYSYADRLETVKVACAATPDRTRDVVSDVRTWYDGATSFDGQVSRGNPTRLEQLAGYSGGTPTYAVMNRLGYDTYGRVVDSYDALDRRTTTGYTPATGGPLSATVTTNAKGWTVTTTVDPAWGTPVGVRDDQSGALTELTYDGLGRLAQVWLPGRPRSTHPQSPSSRYSYLNADSSHPAAVASSTLNTDGSGYRTSYELYDGFARVAQTQQASPAGGSIVADSLHDSRGLVVKQNGPYTTASPPGTTLLGPVDAASRLDDTKVPRQTVTSYDGAARPTASIFYVQGVEKWRTSTYYGGDHVDVTPPDGGTATSMISDARGRVVQRRAYHGGAPTGSYDTTSYGYTADGRIASLTDSTGANVWTWTYDQRDRLVGTTDPDKGATTLGYDAADQLTSSTDARDVTLAYTYDELGRRTATHRDSATGPTLATWTWDTLRKGQLTSSTRYVDGQPYTVAVTGYDADNRPTGARVSIPDVETGLAGDYVTAASYNADGSAATASMVTKTGVSQFGGLADETLSYGYNTVGLPASLTGLIPYVAASGTTPGVGYDGLGRLSSIRRSANAKTVTELWGYQTGTGRLDTHAVYSDVDVAEESHYSYDDAGDITAISNQTAKYWAGPDDNQCFRYDWAGRLAEAWTAPSTDCTSVPSASSPQLGAGPAPYWQSFGYDQAGNRRTVTDHSATATTTHDYAYPDAGQPHPHAVGSVTTRTGTTSVTDGYGYDQVGDTLTRPGTADTQTLTWDPEGHVATSTEAGKTTSYVYDADGNRLLAKDPTGSTLYLGDTEYRRASTGSVTGTRYYRLGDTTIGVRTATGLHWQTADHQGTAQVSYDSATLAKTRRYQLPFGAPRGTGTSWDDPHGFVGGVTDTTGLTHLGAREYDPGLGRFVSVDPVLDIGDPQQATAYCYADNSPVTASDPGGLLLMTRKVDAVDMTEVIVSPGRNMASVDGRNDAHTRPKPFYTYKCTWCSKPPPPPHKSKCGSLAWVCKKASKAGHWVKNHKNDIAGIVVGAAVGAGCTALTGGSLAIACGMLGGAVGSLVTGLLDCRDGQESHCGRGLVADVVIGAALGALGGAAPKVAKAVLSRFVSKGLSTAASDAAADAGRVARFCSFTAATRVLMADGTSKPIAKVRTGDKVLATDPKTGKRVARTVRTLWAHKDLAAALTFAGGLLAVTANHPFWDAADRKWKRADQLHSGDRLLAANGRTVRTGGWSSGDRTLVTAYNLTVDDLHTYYVLAGTTPVLVHNCGETIAGPNLGSLRVSAANPSASEVSAAQHMAARGGNVVLRDPVGTRAGGMTSDLLVDGVAWDVYSPTSRSINNILTNVAKKHSQVNGGGVIVDLSGTGLSADQFGNALGRVNGMIGSWGKQPIGGLEFIGG